MGHPASSRSTHLILDSDQTLLSGDTFRVDSISIANNTAAPVLVTFQSADGTFTYRTLVIPAFETKGDSGDFPFIADRGLKIPAVNADVHINLTHSAPGV
jgi:hypothetical protein